MKLPGRVKKTVDICACLGLDARRSNCHFPSRFSTFIMPKILIDQAVVVRVHACTCINQVMFGACDVSAVHMQVTMRALHVVIDINQRCALRLGEYE